MVEVPDELVEMVGQRRQGRPGTYGPWIDWLSCGVRRNHAESATRLHLDLS